MSVPAEKIEPANDPSKARLRLWLKLLKTSRTIETTLRENLRDAFGTTLPRFDVLAALHRHPKGLRMSDLSGVLRVSNGNVTGIVDRLVTEGLVTRGAVKDDRRALMVRLTRKGREVFEEQASAHEAWLNDMLADVSGGDAETLTAMIDAMQPRIPGKART